ncbi:Response regulator receiver domain-containing protein [Desulfurobacterium pacificum]|uniref:Response regulator receiver domain-containing protein n=1 Tax=Desulfurobacterium pacificum TaxID=240166 RepID=A0ABY1NBB7_9BACT|nr:response regulator [Desulfurobacterium pacificum]SMP05481.1 Response regulator receiver domain-containing protein [Desulfurobacterium pacificum]
MKVLYVDSKKTWHLFFERVLSSRGIEVFHAYTIKEAINLAHTEKPDVIIFNSKVDNLPITEFLSDIKGTGIPFIVIGYKAEGMDKDSLLDAGAFQVLEKPFTVEDLITVLKSLKEKLPEVKKEEIEMEVIGAGGEPLPVVDLDEIEVTPVTEEITLEAEPEISVEEVKPVEEKEIVPVVSEEKEAPKPVEAVVPAATGKVKEALPSEVSLDNAQIEKIVREVAWEVVPELAEKIIREEVKKLIESRLA